MYRMLKFTPDEIQRVEGGRVGIGGKLKGWVSYLPSLMAADGSGGGFDGKSLPDDSSLADLWVDFLLQETEKASGGAAAIPSVVGSVKVPPMGASSASTMADGMATPQLTPKTQSRIAANAQAMSGIVPPQAGASSVASEPGSYPTWTPAAVPSSVPSQSNHFAHSGQFMSQSNGNIAASLSSASPEVWPPTAMQQLAAQQQQPSLQPLSSFPSQSPPQPYLQPFHIPLQSQSQPPPFDAPIQPSAVPAPSAPVPQPTPPPQLGSLIPPPPINPSASITPPPMMQFSQPTTMQRPYPAYTTPFLLNPAGNVNMPATLNGPNTQPPIPPFQPPTQPPQS